MTEEQKMKIRDSLLGEKSYKWKGDKVSYRGLHKWVNHRFGKAQKCEICGKLKTTPKSIHWANKSHLYKRFIEDWIQLCVSCHKKYDLNYLGRPVEKNKNHGKSKCCKAEVRYSGGGYIGEDIVPVVSECTRCGKKDPKIIQKVGRPFKLPF